MNKEIDALVASGRLFDLIPVAAYVCAGDGRILRFNQRAAELWGRSPDLCNPGDRFCGSQRLLRRDGTVVAHADSPMADVLATGTGITNQDIVMERPDGSRVHCLVSIEAIRDGSGAVVGAINCFGEAPRSNELLRGLEDFRRNARDALQALPAAIYTTDAVGRITFYNDAAVALWGRRPGLGTDTFCGSWKLYWPDGTPLPHDECPMAIALREQRAINGMEAAAERPDGTQIPFLAYPVPLFDSAGKLTGALNMLVDISERKGAEVALHRQTERLDLLNHIARSISSDLDIERIVEEVTAAATKLTGAQFGAFFYNVTDNQGERYRLFTLSGAPREAFERFGMPHNTALFGPIFRGEGAIRLDDVHADPRYGHNPPHHGIPQGHPPVASYLAIPVMSRSGQVHGGLFFGHSDPGVFTQEAEDTVAAIAAHAAIAIDNSHLLRSAQQESEQHRLSALAAGRLAAIVESSDDAIVAKDLDGIIKSWNQGAERLFGYTAEEAIGKSVTILIPDNRLDEEPKILASIRRGEPVNHYDTVRQRKDGSLVDISLTVSPIRDADGTIIGASKIARDITERRRAEEQQQLLLREMDHRIKNLFALVGSVVTLSARSAQTPKDLAAALRERLGALARAQSLSLSSPNGNGSGTQPTTMHTLIQTILVPYEQASDNAARLVISGVDIPITGDVVTPFALLLHELATNAAKYGALSSPTGRVDIACHEEGDQVVLLWSEHDGPPIDHPPENEGFGSLLARSMLERQLGGSISREWRPAGLMIRLSVARDRLTGGQQ